MAVGTRGAAMAPPDFDRSVNFYLNQDRGGADYAQHISICPPLPPGFSDLPTVLLRK